MGLKKHLPVIKGIIFVLIFLIATTKLATSCMVKSDEFGQPSNLNCQLASHQGRRKYQEDRMLCTHDVHTLGGGFKNTTIHIAAIFDGHNGAEASDMASNLLLKYFSQHVHSLLAAARYEEISMTCQLPHSNIGLHSYDLNLESHECKGISPFPSRPIYTEILKESMLKTIHDIDLTFSKDAFEKNLKSGSTAVVALIVDDEILVLNVGDSKAILCSKSTYLPREVKASLAILNRRKTRKPKTSAKTDENLRTSFDPKCYLVDELSKDHHPDIDVERNRVEAAGGYVEEWGGVSRVNGQLAVSRSIGDVHFKRYGVISTPAVADWRPITNDHSYLVLGSDGIFEELTTQEICNLLWDANFQADVTIGTDSSSNNSLADYIVNVASERGTTDNMSVIVISL